VTGCPFPEIPELPIPTRCLLVILTPSDHYQDEAAAIGKAAGVVFTDEIFSR
jgi:hypothetical protein